MNILKCEGHKFPELKEADAMFASDVAPEWADGECCNRCRVTFSVLQRKHHCRNCGQVFCAQCSAKTSTLPKYGYEKEVRVCEGCFILLQQRPSSGSTTVPKVAPKDEAILPEEYLKSSLAQQSQTPPTRTEQEIQEEEELQLAIALSQSEAEQQAKIKAHFSLPRSYTAPRPPSPEAVRPARSPSPDEMERNPELAKYLNRDYWESKQFNNKDASPLSPTAPSPMSSIASSIPLKNPIDDPEMDEFSALMRTQIETFVNRMRSASARGRNINNDTSIQSLFLNISSLHAKLLTYIKEMDDKRMWYESLQDKIGQIKDSRAALDVLRQEHQDKLRRIAEEQERQRQIQMAHKLEIMRKKKQEYLQYQRQLALQRIQEQEREMQMRMEHQKAQYRISTQGFPFMPPGAQVMPGQQPGMIMPGNMPGAFQNYNFTGMPGSGQNPQMGGMNPNQMQPQGQPIPGQMPPTGQIPQQGTVPVPMTLPNQQPQMHSIPGQQPQSMGMMSPPQMLPGQQMIPGPGQNHPPQGMGQGMPPQGNIPQQMVPPVPQQMPVPAPQQILTNSEQPNQAAPVNMQQVPQPTAIVTTQPAPVATEKPAEPEIAELISFD